MLNKEQAAAELEKIKNPHWAEARLADAQDRSEPIRDTARLLLDSGGSSEQLRQVGRSQVFRQKLLALDESAQRGFL